MKREEAYQQVTARIVQALEAGTVPWRKPWKTTGAPFAGAPRSIRGHYYRGINQFLAFAPYSSPFWLTFNQARELGGSVRKGEKGWKVLLWKISDGKGDESEGGEPGEGGRRFYATTYTVFNLEQCDGVKVPAKLTRDAVPASPEGRIEAAEAIVSGYAAGPSIVQGGDRACYSPSADRVYVPSLSAFRSPELYYSVLFHELTHSTGHESRLARDFRGMGDAYAQEELVAELGAAFLSMAAGIETTGTLEDSAAYIKAWLAKFRDDGGKSLVMAASAAQKAADLILGSAAAQAEAA